MTFDSPTAVRHLQALERQLAETPRHHQALCLAWATGDRQAARCATLHAETHVRAMAITTANLKAHVVRADGLGSTLDSLSELALRAVRLVVFAELDALCALAHARPERAQPLPMSWGRVRGLADLTSSVRAETDRILDSCLTRPETAQGDRCAYRAALHEAHTSMRRLGTASEFARFLWEGRRRSDWPSLQARCTLISAALTVRIDVEPDATLVVRTSVPEAQATERAS